MRRGGWAIPLSTSSPELGQAGQRRRAAFPVKAEGWPRLVPVVDRTFDFPVMTRLVYRYRVVRDPGFERGLSRLCWISCQREKSARTGTDTTTTPGAFRGTDGSMQVQRRVIPGSTFDRRSRLWPLAGWRVFCDHSRLESHGFRIRD
jgi:hypothetical protein